MEKTLITLPCGCSYKTFDNCTCDEVYCLKHQEERNAVQLADVKERRKLEIALRLKDIDGEAGPRAVRDILIADGRKGFNNKIETLENEAKALRTELAGL